MIELSPYSLVEFIKEKCMVINTINTKGYMGKGLAKEFAMWFPKMEEEYIEKCSKNEIRPGDLWIWENKEFLIGNIATKDDYKFPSKIEWVSKGLSQLRGYIENNDIRSVAIPKLGAALGKLDWSLVERKILELLGDSKTHITVALDIKIGPKEKSALEEMLQSMKQCCGRDSIKNTPIFSGNSEEYCEIPKNMKKLLCIISENSQKIKRFRDIRKIKGIGDKGYRELLKTFWI